LYAPVIDEYPVDQGPRGEVVVVVEVVVEVMVVGGVVVVVVVGGVVVVVVVVVVVGVVVVVVVGGVVVVVVVVGVVVVVVVGGVVVVVVEVTATLLTISVSFFEALPAKFRLPVYTAVIWCAVGVNTIPCEVVPGEALTVSVAVPVPG
jgi:hypothetical protein